jgi:hypothetical protein
MPTIESRPFERRMSPSLIEALKTEKLYSERLSLDVHGQSPAKDRVFPAIRRERMDFYYRGGRLFSYDRSGFRTHPKYALAFEDGTKPRGAISESDLAELRPVPSFVRGYASMKKMCALYGGDEARQVAELSGRYSYSIKREDVPVVVLDVEASFDARSRDESDNDQDRIDLVLFSISERSLMFVEVKLFANPALRASEGVEPKIVSQIKRYRAQVQQNRVAILDAYSVYVTAASKMFGVSMPTPEKVIDDVPLLTVGFDGDQQGGQGTKIWQRLERSGVHCLGIGEATGAEPNTLKKWFRKVMNTRSRGSST